MCGLFKGSLFPVFITIKYFLKQTWSGSRMMHTQQEKNMFESMMNTHRIWIAF